MHKRLFSILLLILIGIVVPVHAQSTRDYAILDITYDVNDDQSQLILNVTVENLGADATTASNIVVMINDSTPRILIEDTIDPIATGEVIVIPLELSVDDFPVDGTQVIEVSVGIDAFEIANTEIAQNNVREVPITIATVGTDNVILFQMNDASFIILGYEFSREDAVLYLALFVVGIVVLWLITVFLRLIFRRPPRLGTWQPPYGIMPMYDQNTVEGRRQAWQTHAQNSLLLAAPTDGNVHPVKMLIGTDGVNLNNWKITAMRLSQYDTYGRISRSQAVAPKGLLNRFNKVLKRRHGQPDKKIQRMLNPIARKLVGQFRKKVNKKNGFLPVAMDIRLTGKHGEVRIVFELYQCQGRAWYRLDQWEPTMMVVSQSMQENFTFTIHGRMGNEKMKEFFDRLRDDVIWLLLEMVRVEEAMPEPEQEERREAYNVPDTLSGMQPIGDDSQPQPSTA